MNYDAVLVSRKCRVADQADIIQYMRCGRPSGAVILLIENKYNTGNLRRARSMESVTTQVISIQETHDHDNGN